MGVAPVTYGDGLVERVRALAPDGVDAALDIAGEDALRASVELAKDANRVRIMASDELAVELRVPTVTPKRFNGQLAELAEPTHRASSSCTSDRHSRLRRLLGHTA